MLASDIISTADPDYRQKYAATIQDLTADDLMRAAKQKLDPDAASLVLLHPAGEDEEIPYPKRDPDATLTRDDWVEQIDLDNDTLLRKLKRKLADGSAEGRQAITVDPPVIRELSNGLTVIAQRSTVVPAVAVQLYTRGGLLADEPGQEGVANAAATMLMRGTTSRSAQDIATSLEDLGATLGSAAGNNTSYLRGTALADDWPTLLEIMADVALNPAFDEQEWQSVQPRLLAAVDRATDRWSGELRSRFREAYFADHPWSQTTLGRARVIRDLTPDKLREAHEQRLAAESSILAIVGDIDPERAFELAEQTFGKMPANAGESFEPPLPGEPASRVVFHPTAKPVAAVQIGLGPGITRDDPDYAALRVLSTVMGDFPSGWLQQELRGKGPGLAYAASVGNVTGIVPGYFTLLFNTDPANLVEATSRAMAIVDRARTQPILNVDLERAKAKVLTNEFAARQSNSDLAAGQALDRLYGIDDPTGQALLEQVQALTAADLRDVANRRLTDPVITIIANEPIETEAIEKLLPGENN
jgi:zinc protease